jgi:hypothetical protein
MAELSKTTFADLAGFAADIEAGTYEAPEGTLPHTTKTRRGLRTKRLM